MFRSAARIERKLSPPKHWPTMYIIYNKKFLSLSSIYGPLRDEWELYIESALEAFIVWGNVLFLLLNHCGNKNLFGHCLITKIGLALFENTLCGRTWICGKMWWILGNRHDFHTAQVAYAVLIHFSDTWWSKLGGRALSFFSCKKKHIFPSKIKINRDLHGSFVSYPMVRKSVEWISKKMIEILSQRFLSTLGLFPGD